MSQKLVLEESRFTDLIRIDEQYDRLKICNQSDKKVDAGVLTNYLKQIEGINRIETLTINYNSSLDDLYVLKAFTNLRSLFVHGAQIKTFNGIQWYKGKYIQIQTHRNRRRDISQISQTRVENVDLFVERMEDFSAIAGCEYLKQIDIFHSLEPNFREWKNMPAETVSFKSCKFKELGNLSLVPNINDLSVLGCRNLEQFTGDNSNIKRLVVDSCKKLNLSTLKTFAEIEILIVNSCTKELNLTEISRLKYIKVVKFILCNVEVELINLKNYFPKIESLHISGMKKEYGMQLKQLNPDVKITSSSFEL
ncbi:hypothetical protein ACFO9Q_02990 [Paenibacillus sp. GCM10023252]|uniref:hypothetical protein n=1 Tax=Paenibacillus sp. GCM10023252 TaxID=3252649 RepID=UPI003620A715